MSLNPSNKSNPCPVCEDITGKCRQGREDSQYWQCMGYPDTRKGEVVGAYKCIGQTRDKLWGQFRINEGEHHGQRILQKNSTNSRAQTQGRTSSIPLSAVQGQTRNHPRRMATNGEHVSSRDEEPRRKTNHLSDGERDRAIRNLSSYLGLSQRHREDLRSRGLGDHQIESLLYFTITPNKKIPFEIPASLPGIKDGQIKAAGTGYACVAFNHQGQATGWQIRLDNATDNKYRWAKGEVSSHLENGELPTTSIYPTAIKHPGIWAFEGISKPAIASHRLGIVAIGAASANFASSPEQTQQHLKAASERLETKEVIFAPDAGAVENSHVLKAYKRSWELFTKLGYQLKIAWWGQKTKDHPDIDELDDLSKIEFINPEDFLTWVKTKLSSSPQNTISIPLNPPLIASLPIQPLKDGISKVLPIPESVASSLIMEEKAPRKERRWFERVLKRIKKVFSETKQQLPKLGFKCLEADNPEFEEKIRQAQRKIRSLSYDADIELSQRYLPDELVNQLPKSGLVGIKAPKGCGKSVLLKKIIALAKKQGIPVLSITPRIALGREQAIKWEITWIDDHGVLRTRAGDTTSQIQEVAEKRAKAREKLAELEDVKHHQLSLLGEAEILAFEQQKADLRLEIERYGEEIANINSASVRTLALCWDSLWRTKDRDLQEALIIIDEAELGFQHFISGSTCKRNRPQLLQVFKTKLIECLMSGGRVILSDADLTDLPINYIRAVLPIPIKPFIVTNDYIGDETRWIVDLRTGSRGNTLTDIIEATRDGQYLAITTDSQAEAQALERRILQELSDDLCAFLDSEGNITDDAQARKKALIVRVDRTTTESEAGKKFIQKPNEQILHLKPRILIYTPSMGVGVSIDESTQRWDEEWEEMVPYFDAVYGLFFGVIEPSQCRQQLARFRANVPRIVWCKDSNRALEGCSSFFPDEIKRQTLKYNHSALNILDIAKGIAGYEADDEEIREAMLQLLTEAWDSNSRCWKEPSIDLASAFKARENYGKWNLANLLREELQDEGHTTISLKGIKTDEVRQMADIKDDQKMEEATLIAEAPLMSVEEARETINKLGQTKERYRSAQKSLLQEELPEVELTPAFIKKAVIDDRRRWLNQQKLFWYFTNDEALQQVDTDHWLGNLKRFAQGIPFMRDVRSHSPRVEALRKSGIFDFVCLKDCDRIYEGDTPEAQKFLKQCLKHKHLLQTALNVLVTKKSSPIGLANRILGKVGLALEKLTRSNKDTRWKLSADFANDSDRANVLGAFELRWKMSQEEAAQKIAQKQAQTQSQQATQLGGQSTDYIYTNQTSPPNIIDEVSQGDNELLQGSPLEELAEALRYCDAPNMLAAAIEGYPSEVVEDAIALQDNQPRRMELARWLEEVSGKAAEEVVHPPLSAYKQGDEVWAFFPQCEQKWRRAVVAIHGQAIRAVSDLFGIFVERPHLIAPGDWELIT